jgi:hypothetical protein
MRPQKGGCLVEDWDENGHPYYNVAKNLAK